MLGESKAEWLSMRFHLTTTPTPWHQDSHHLSFAGYRHEKTNTANVLFSRTCNVIVLANTIII